MTQYLVGLAAGLASALLYAAVQSGGGLGMPLLLLSPLPVAIAGLGWGTTAGALAAVVAGAALAGFAAPALGFGFFLLISGPIALYAHLASLARPASDGTGDGTALEWYPLSRLLLVMAAVTSASLVISGAVGGYSSDLLATEFATLFREVIAATPDAPVIAPEDIAIAAAFYARVLPFASGFFVVLVMGCALWLGGRVVAASGRLQRPGRLADGLALPVLAAVVFAAALVLAFTAGPVGLAAGVVAGAFGMAYAIVGFAVLHVATRGVAGRGFILAAAYVLFPFISLIPHAGLGIADSLFDIRRRRRRGS